MYSLIHISDFDKEHAYILIAMWIYAAVPEKMLMVYAMIFGAHLLPYGWLYQSKTYYVLSVIIPILVLFIGCNYPPVTIAILMLFTEIIFCICLIIENARKKLRDKETKHPYFQVY